MEGRSTAGTAVATGRGAETKNPRRAGEHGGGIHVVSVGREAGVVYP